MNIKHFPHYHKPDTPITRANTNRQSFTPTTNKFIYYPVKLSNTFQTSTPRPKKKLFKPHSSSDSGMISCPEKSPLVMVCRTTTTDFNIHPGPTTRSRKRRLELLPDQSFESGLLDTSGSDQSSSGGASSKECSPDKDQAQPSKLVKTEAGADTSCISTGSTDDFFGDSQEISRILENSSMNIIDLDDIDNLLN